MPRLSFVIPVLDEAQVLPALLERLRRDFPGAELIVADGGSGDGSVAVALRGADTVLLGERGRAAQMNLGAATASGDTLCFLHADTYPLFTGEQLVDALGEGFRWGFCRVSLRSDLRALRLVGGSMNLRSRLTRVATGDQLLLVRRDLFERLGGFAPIPLMEDVEICKRLRRETPGRALALAVSSSGRRWERHGVLRTIVLMWRLRLEYWLGVSPQRLWARYYGHTPGGDAASGAVP